MTRPGDRVHITSWEQLQERIHFILERLNAEPLLALAAAVNPLHALEELGFDIDAAIRPTIEERLRFKPRVQARLRHLREEIHQHAGHAFDIDSPHELERILFDRLGIRRPAHLAPPDATAARGGTSIGLRSRAQAANRESPAEDPLEGLRGSHPIIEPLLEYRHLEASAPRLAPRELYDAVRRGERRLGVMNIRARLKNQPP